MPITISKKLFFAAALGTLIEYYDITLFTFFLPIISPIFFPSDSLMQALTNGFYALLIAALTRPLGGLVFGYLGDMSGRRHALLNSMYGIAIATIIIGLTPGFTTIGYWAPIIIIACKAVQSLCFGGEYNGAGIYVVEHAANQHEAFIGSLLTASTLFGSLLASLTGILITLHFMPEWGWRIAFILGGGLGLLGIFYRKNLLETPCFSSANLKQQHLMNMLKHYPKELVAGIFIGGFATLPFTTVLVFINPILTSKKFFTTHQLMLIQTLLIVIAILTLLLSGKLADQKSSSKVMQFGCFLLISLTYPLLLLIDQNNAVGIIFAEIIFIMINEILLGPANAYLKNLFAMEYRYRASSVSFCFGMAVIGGLTPIIENKLYQMHYHFRDIALWLIFIGICTFFLLKQKTDAYVNKLVKE